MFICAMLNQRLYVNVESTFVVFKRLFKFQIQIYFQHYFNYILSTLNQHTRARWDVYLDIVCKQIIICCYKSGFSIFWKYFCVDTN